MRVFWEVDLQNDFMNKNGKLYVPNAEELKPVLKKLKNYAEKKEIQVLGSVDRHFKDDHELKTFPPHCMNKTEGQKIISEMENTNTTFIGDKYCEMGKFKKYYSGELIDMIKLGENGKIIFEKQHTDVFVNPHTGFVLNKLGVTKVVVYGVATEFCVKDAVLGLLKRGIEVYLVTDAIKGIDKKESQKAIDEMVQKGAFLIKSDEILKGD